MLLDTDTEKTGKSQFKLTNWKEDRMRGLGPVTLHQGRRGSHLQMWKSVWVLQ